MSSSLMARAEWPYPSGVRRFYVGFNYLCEEIRDVSTACARERDDGEAAQEAQPAHRRACKPMRPTPAGLRLYPKPTAWLEALVHLSGEVLFTQIRGRHDT